MLFDYPRELRTNQALVVGMHAFFVKLGIASPIFIGASDSGMVAQIYTQKYPNEVGGTFLIRGSLGIGDHSFRCQHTADKFIKQKFGMVAKGYLPAAVLNYLLLLGWAPEGEQEIFSLEEMIKIWDPARISKSPAIFDPLKLRAINAAYIRALPAEEFRRLADPFIDRAVHRDIDRDLLCANLQPRCEVLEDIPPQLDFFDAVLPIDAEMYRNKKQKTTPESAKEALAALLPVLEAQADWNRDAIFEACKTLAEQMEKKNGWLLFPLGIALSGKARTPGGGTDLAAMMGKEETIVRVKAALEKL